MIEWLSDLVGSFHWLRPWALAGLMLVWVVHWRGRQQAQRRHASWHGVIDPHLIPHVIVPGDCAGVFKPVNALTLALVLACVALAGPSWKHEPVPFVDDTAPLMIALDLSPAMNGVDTTPTRLARARLKIRQLLERRGKAPTGLVVYAGSAHLVLPPAADRFVLDSYLEALSTSLMPVPGQRPGLALEMASEWLNRSGAVGTVLFMTADAPAAELDAFKQHQHDSPHVVAVLALGTAQGGPVRASMGGQAQAHVRRDDPGLQVLQDKAGVIVVATTVDERDLQALEGRIAVARVRAIAQDPRARWQDEGLWLIWPVLLLMLLLFRRGWSVRWEALPVVIAGCLGFGGLHSESALAAESKSGFFDDSFYGLWLTPDQQGRWLLEHQRPAEAASRFRDPLWQGVALKQAGDFPGAAEAFAHVDSAAGWFNRAQMLARQGLFQEAVDAYDEALRRAPGWADALADRESVATLARLAAAHAREVAGDDEAVCEDDEPDGVEPAGQPDEQGAGQRLPINQQQRAEQWLKRLDTSPADFLRRKFEIQARAQGEGGTPP